MKYRVVKVKNPRTVANNSEPRIIKIKALQKDMDIYSGLDKRGTPITIAKISNTKDTAQQIVGRRLGISNNLICVYNTNDIFGNFTDRREVNLTFESALAWNKLEMPDEITARVVLYEGDDYSDEAGEKAVEDKVFNNWMQSVDNAITRWQSAMLDRIIRANPCTFDRALKSAMKKYFPADADTEDTAEGSTEDTTVNN